MSQDLSTILDAEIQQLQNKKTDALQALHPQLYVKAKVSKYRRAWWDEWQRMLRSKDPKEKRLAIIEYNKLQCRILPTELDAGDGKAVVVNVMNWAGQINQQPLPTNNNNPQVDDLS